MLAIQVLWTLAKTAFFQHEDRSPAALALVGEPVPRQLHQQDGFHTSVTPEPLGKEMRDDGNHCE